MPDGRVFIGKSSRDRLSVCLEAKVSEGRMCERCTANKLRATDLMAEAATAVQLEKSWPEDHRTNEELSCCARVMVCGCTVP